MTIIRSDDDSKGQLFIHCLIDESIPSYLECYANLSSDGTTLTVLAANVEFAGWPDVLLSNFDMTVSADGKTLTFEGPIVSSYQTQYQNYTATKQ